MGLSLNEVVKPQTVELNKRASIISNEQSPSKRLYVEGESPNFNKSDFFYLIKKFKELYQLPYSLYKTINLIKKDHLSENKKMTDIIFKELNKLLENLGVDEYGFFEITPEKIFKGCGVPYKYALVFSSGMNKEIINTSPSIKCQVEVAKVYVKTGNTANMVAQFLQKKGFSASPNHSMGGQLDYSMAAEWAGIAAIGRHSMAITKKNGPCNRLSVVYTDIDNLGDFIMHNTQEMDWIESFCKTCGKCIRKCPKEAILSEPLILDGVHPTKIDYQKCCEGFKSYGCGICMKECPFTTGDYEKIKQAYLKKPNMNDKGV